MSCEDPELYYVRTDVGRLHYAKAGLGAPVLLLHQSPRSWDEYRDVLPILRSKVPSDCDGHGWLWGLNAEHGG